MPRIALPGKPIAITGASSGIGRATALACARAGMPVAIAARRADKLKEVVAEIQSLGGRAIAVECDVVKPDQCRALTEETVRAFGSIYAVFANAGYGFEANVHESTDEAIREIFEVNFWGTLNTVRPALDHMLRAGSGHIVMCSSVVSKMGIPTMAAYSATKAAQDHFGRAMRIELHKRVHVSTVHPIGTNTEFSAIVTERGGNKPRTARAPEGFRQTPNQVAAAVVQCLARPRGEVWTSLTGRTLAAVGTMFPSFADAMLRRHFLKKIATANAAKK